MSATAKVSIPFESQSDPQSARDCGAACLSMVYRSLGKEIPRGEIWPAIAKENRFGNLSSTTHLITQDALARGLSAVALQARHPLQALRVCRESGVRAILNLRPTSDAASGHYAVLVDIDAEDVVLNDPFYGPARRVPHAELLALWQPRMPNSEIIGYVLVAIAAEPGALTPCWLCHAPVLPAVACPRCKQTVPLQPGAALGCISSDCIARLWNFICCPACDYVFTFSLDAEAPASAQSAGMHTGTGGSSGALPDGAAPSASDPLDLSAAFAAIEKFCSHILTIPGAADHPGIKKQLDFIASSKEKLKLAQAEALVHRKSHEEQLAKMVETAKQNEEAHRKKMEDLNRTSPPLDGNALGRALLRNLGFTS